MNIKAFVNKITFIEAANRYYKLNIDEAMLPANLNCIFHSDDSPSMRVYPEFRGAHCWGCGKSYDSWDVLVKYSRSTSEAIERAKKDWGIDVSDIKSKSPDKDTKQSIDKVIT